jgi:UDP-glucose 4-epimerase
MRDVFAAARPHVVFHLAAQIDVRRSVADPSTDAHVNVGGTAAVLEAARHAGAWRVLLASTASVDGDPPVSNVYGPRQDPHGDSGVVAIFAAAARAGRAATIYGDGTQTRDYHFVHDAVRALVAAAYSDASGVVNVSTGTETTLLDLAQTLGVQTRFACGRPGEIAHSCLDPRRAVRVLGWRATVPLADGLRRTVSQATAV